MDDTQKLESGLADLKTDVYLLDGVVATIERAENAQAHFSLPVPTDESERLYVVNGDALAALTRMFHALKADLAVMEQAFYGKPADKLAA